jgi:hypothetical protein
MSALWAAMSRRQQARLTLAIHEGEALAALLGIMFGRRYSLFKVGRSRKQARLHASELLEHEALTWAQARGYEIADWVGISKATALRALAGHKVTELNSDTADAYKMRFGGHALLLPPPLIWIGNPLFRLSYRVAKPVVSVLKTWRAT